MRTLAITMLVALVGLAGCLEGSDTPDVDTSGAAGLDLPPITLVESVVDVETIDDVHDPYEPTMDVCDDGSIYITGHTFLVDTTGAPVWGSHDDGDSWAQLPWFQDQTMPEGVPGATPPVSDEIFLACGDDGMLYGSDITLASYPVNAWSGYGSAHEYWNFNAYNEADVATQATECVARPAKDRPWAAYNNGTLLVTSNPAGAENQIGVVDVPFAAPAPASYGTVIDGIEWNLCAGPGGSIPGVPDINSQGLFAAPQKSGGSLWLTVGHKDNVLDVRNIELFDSSSGGEITSHYGHATFDIDDALYVGITTNEEPVEVDGNWTGNMTFAVSLDDGESFEVVELTTGEGQLRHFYMDANRFGAGALVVWAKDDVQDNETDEAVGYDWYMGHLHHDENGVPYLANVALVIDEGTQPSAHVTGAAVGPDGRAYTAMYDRAETRLSVFIQRDGPTLPVSMVAVDAVETPEQ